MITQNIQIEPKKPAIWLIFNAQKLVQFVDQPGLMKTSWEKLTFAHAYQEQIVQIGSHDEQPCYMVDMGNEQIEDDSLQAISLRAMLMQSELALFGIASRAWQIALFMRTHRFCGQCGSTMQQIDWEMAMQCSRCNLRCYPRISPCIIVAIRDADRLLLAQGKPQRSRQMFSTLAGFVESGETLEQTVHREVFEEVGIKVKNLRYFASQPWPFPHSLMVGFLADYESGEIEVDGHEILQAHWYPYNDLPNIPPPFSIAGQLIAQTIIDIEQDLDTSNTQAVQLKNPT
ncbi:MAG: NAD+ diphosphatase [Paraglaciecola sp.]|jgi:NAD+ diphosphatase